MVLVVSALTAGSDAASAGDTLSGNGALVALPAPLTSSAEDTLLPADGSSGLAAMAKQFGLQNSSSGSGALAQIQNGHLGFFSVQPQGSQGSDVMKQLLRNEAPGGGLKLQFKW
jgi:hypothetical protein